MSISAVAREMLGRTIGGRFRIDAVIGEGAMGVVYRAHHTGLRKDVALKLLHRQLTANAEMVARFDREAAAASRLDHINCVRVLDYGATDDDRSYLVMELLDGQELSELVGTPVAPTRAIEIFEQVLHGLDHAHGHGLVHRDIKPENIFITKGAGGERIKLLDFGIAKMQDAQGAAPLTRAGAVFGTPSYMSPEQCAGKSTDLRTDLYSAGVVMYELLSGKPPFDGDDPTAILRGHLMTPPPPLPASVPKALRDFVTCMMQKNPDDRFATANAAIEALEAVKGQAEAKPASDRFKRGAGLPPPPGGLPKLEARPPLAVPSVPSVSAGHTVRASSPVAPPSVNRAAPPPPPPVDLASAEAPPPPAMDRASAEAPARPHTDLAGVEAPPPPAMDHAAASAAPAPSGPVAAAASSPHAPIRAAARAPQLRALLDDALARLRVLANHRPWIKPALIGGGALLVVIIVAIWPKANEHGTSASDAKKGDRDASAERTGDADDDDAAAEANADDEIAIDDQQQKPAGEEPSKADRALRANLASIDALIASKQYDSARITLAPLLEVYNDEPTLHWRMGKVLFVLNPKVNATAALESYRGAIALNAELLDDPAFAGEFWPLLDLPKHRALAVEIAIELLGDAAYDRIAKWINVQSDPLPYATRHRAIEHLTDVGRVATINAPLQVALDLWQAPTTDDPCDAFAAALATAEKEPDSFLWGSIVDAPTPSTGEGAECPGLAQTRSTLAAQYAERYAGLNRIVPAAYTKRRRPAGR